MSEKQQTAVEWLEKRYYFTNGQLIDVDFEQAKEMEKTQIIFHSIELCKLLLSNPIEKNGKQPMELAESYFKNYSK